MSRGSLRGALSRGARGTATTELVLVLPFLAFILALLIFFGRAMVRVQRAQVMDRYEAWRDAAGAIELRAADMNDLASLTGGTPRGPHSTAGNELLNSTFFAGNADEITATPSRSLADDAPQGLIDAAGAFSADTQALADSLIGGLPRAVGAGFETTFPAQKGYLSFLVGSIQYSHTRISHEWAFASGSRALILDDRDGLYLSATPLSASEADQQRQDRLLLTLRDQRDQRLLVLRGQAGGSIIPRSYGFDVWQRTGPGASPLGAASGVFFEDMNTALTGGGNEFTDAIRAQYLGSPSYAGPTLPAQQ